jgi:hypothetical protein
MAPPICPKREQIIPSDDVSVASESDGGRQRKTYIVIETREGKQLKFGSMLTEELRKFVAGALRRVLPG